jgi:hypothetical protein
MRKPIGKRIEQVCAACETESTFSEIAFLMGLSDNTGNAYQHIIKAQKFGFITKTGARNTARYIAKPNWRAMIKAHNAKPQIKEVPGYVMIRRYAPSMMGRVNSVFQLGAMQ